MSPWLKAGLIGGGILFVLDLIGQIPFIGCCTWILMLIVYVVVGVLAASYMTPPRNAGNAAGQGALAAMIASFIGGVFNLIFGIGRALIWSSVTQMGQVWSQLPPEVRDQFHQLGVTPDFLVGIGGASLCGSICCMTGVIIAAILGAIGAAIYASTKSE